MMTAEVVEASAVKAVVVIVAIVVRKIMATRCSIA
jgi:hypothetical protein